MFSSLLTADQPPAVDQTLVDAGIKVIETLPSLEATAQIVFFMAMIVIAVVVAYVIVQNKRIAADVEAKASDLVSTNALIPIVEEIHRTVNSAVSATTESAGAIRHMTDQIVSSLANSQVQLLQQFDRLHDRLDDSIKATQDTHTALLVLTAQLRPSAGSPATPPVAAE